MYASEAGLKPSSLATSLKLEADFRSFSLDIQRGARLTGPTGTLTQ
jgi:hypothetical protein